MMTWQFLKITFALRDKVENGSERNEVTLRKENRAENCQNKIVYLFSKDLS
jgi:hypothetical protein